MLSLCLTQVLDEKSHFSRNHLADIRSDISAEIMKVLTLVEQEPFPHGFANCQGFWSSAYNGSHHPPVASRLNFFLPVNWMSRFWKESHFIVSNCHFGPTERYLYCNMMFRYFLRIVILDQQKDIYFVL